MSYSQVSHVGHESNYPSLIPGEYPGPPLPPPRPGFEQGYGGGPPPLVGGPGYQGYFTDNYPPQAGYIHHSGTNRPPPLQPYYSDYSTSYDRLNGCSSLLRACLAALCCCCFMEECCR